ncbi:vWA domain-containing protein [Marinovum sp.]|uniref:vWA domain-containing protein n=1 Tax=Marinovum sp. TaxID=2024839 RepID=UPI002B27B5FE|nr:VWA domain-containing protein [Marinovum sp.]
MSFLRVFVFTLLALPGLVSAQNSPRIILVLDGSGSMWGQIDGTAKIEIAQKVMGDLLAALPADQELGLTAYGHRTKGDCSDIETLVSPGAGTREAISQAVNGIQPRGKTPMTDAVVAAAEALRHTEEKATVILVSDGIETCNPDPCAAARVLEQTGVDFTVHVVGFDVSDPEALKQMQCLADETGGRFLSAANASELGEALTEVAAAPEPVPVTVDFLATEGDGGPRIETPLIWNLSQGDSAILDFERGATVQADLLPGDYLVSVLRPEDEASAELTFTQAEAAQTVTLVLPSLLPPAHLDAADSAPAGSTLPVRWEGPDAKNDYISVALPEDAGYESYVYTRKGTPGELLMPARPGRFELRYVLADGRKTLATRPITVTEVTASLDAEGTTVAGATLAVSWDGPDYANDYISVARVGDDGYENYVYTRKGSPGALLMPPVPGDYELRYVISQDRTVLATRKVTVAEATATLAADDTAVAGATLPVTWEGPDYANDYISVARLGDDGYENYAYTRKGSPAEVVMPTVPGHYELRYVMSQDRTVLATLPIEVVEITATLEAPSEAAAGQPLDVSWTGPDYANDYIAIARPGDGGHEAYAFTRKGTPVAVTMPLVPGSYELRYVMSQDRTVLATLPIEVQDVQARLDLPETARAGAVIVVDWDGPGYDRDYISIARPGDTRHDAYTYTRTGAPLLLRTPAVPGTYEVRYVAASNGTAILARKEITLTEVSAEVKAAERGAAGGNLAVDWEGPDFKDDYIAIARAQSSDDEYESYARTSEDSPLILKLPEQPGAYELRYVIGQNRKVIARQPLTVD